MGAMDYLSSLHWLDLLSALITLAAEFVAIFYLDEDAHSPIWFFLLLTMMPALSAIFGAIATCTPCKWDDMFVAIATAVLMNVTFAYFCSGSAGVDANGGSLMGFGEFETLVPPVFFGVAGAVQVLIAIILYAMEKPCGGGDSGDETDAMFGCAAGCQQVCMGGIYPTLIGLSMILYQVYTPWHSLRGDWFEYVFVVYLWIADVGSADKIEKAARKLKDEETPPSLMAIVTLLSQPALFIATLVANGQSLNMAADLVYVVPPCQWPPEYWAGTYTGNFTLRGDDTGALPNKENCSEWFGWDGLFDENHTLATYDIDELDLTVSIGPYAPFPGTTPFPQGDQKYQAYDFIKRDVYEANKEAWTTNRPYPRQYFFNDHPDAGGRSFDYIYSMFGVITGAIAGCGLLCTTPIQLKALCKGEDVGGGIGDIAMGGKAVSTD